MRVIFLAITFSSLLYANNIEIKPLFKKFYRLGYWWPVSFSTKNPTTTEQKITSRLDQFEIEQSFLRHAISYFQVYNNFPQLTVRVQANSPIKTKKNFSLQRVLEREILVGIYGDSELFTLLLAQNFVGKKTYNILLKQLPNKWQALAALNFLILTKEPAKYSLLAIEKWVLAGGRLVVASPLLLENKIIQKICTTKHKSFFQNKWKSFSYGLGKGVYLESGPVFAWSHANIDIWKKVIPFLGQPLVIPAYSNEDATLSEVFTPVAWHTKTVWVLLGICLLHTFLLLWFYKNKKNFFIKSAILTLVVFVISYGYLKSYLRVFHSVLTITAAKPNISTVLKQNYHYFFSLGPQNGYYKFSSLPAPVQKGPVKIIQTKKNWIVCKPLFAKGMFSLWQTLDVVDLIGSVHLQKTSKQIWFNNNIEMKLKQVLFLSHSGVISMGNLSIGEKKAVLFSSPKIPFFLLDSLPPPWDKKMLQWLRAQIPLESFCAYGASLPPSHKVAAYQNRQILWVAMDR